MSMSVVDAISAVAVICGRAAPSVPGAARVNLRRASKVNVVAGPVAIAGQFW